jgi:hypothetical protein
VCSKSVSANINSYLIGRPKGKERPSVLEVGAERVIFGERRERPGCGRKCGEPEGVFLLRVENVFSFVVMGLWGFLNVGLLRVAFSSPLGRRQGAATAARDRRHGGKENIGNFMNLRLRFREFPK